MCTIRMTRIRSAVCLLVLLATTGGCGDDAPITTSEPEPEPEPARIEVAPGDTTLQVEDTTRFRAAVLDATGNELSDFDVAWHSSDTTVLSVTADGLARGVGGGIAEAIASLDDLEGRAEARVKLPLEGAPGLTGNIFYGYQGWFRCPGDEANAEWRHWFFAQTPTADELSVEMWPDVSELDADELCRTDMTLPDGSPAYAFSSNNRKTVMRHFRWMREYGLDGAILQRFFSEPGTDLRRDRTVTSYIRDAAEVYGRRFFVGYDGLADADRALEFIQDDWAMMVDDLGLVESPSYVKVDGKPVVGIWGYGFRGDDDSPGATPEEAMAVIRWLQEEAPPRMRAVVMGGVPAWWRTLTRDSKSDPAWAEVYRSFDVISPWLVGRFANEAEADDILREVIIPDLEETRRLGIHYVPVAWPGFSFQNLHGTPFNEIPRNGGRLFWRQIYNMVSAGVETISVAMFDEVDEATAMFKVAPTSDELPVGARLLPLDADGYDLPSDWYLRLGREAGKMFRGEIPLSPEMPITPPKK